MAKVDWKKHNLPAFTEEANYQEKIENVKAEYVGLETADLAREFKVAKLKKKELEEQVNDLNVGLAALSQLLVENLQGQELQKVSLDAGGTVYLQAEVYPSTKDRAALQNWVIAEEMMEVLTVNYRTLQGIVKERLMAGEALPPGVEVFLKTSAKLIGLND
jgi:hypothetical protein